jgi:hypothetical protein
MQKTRTLSLDNLRNAVLNKLKVVVKRREHVLVLKTKTKAGE